MADTKSSGPNDAPTSGQRAQGTTPEIGQNFKHGTRFHDVSQRKGGVPIQEEAQEPPAPGAIDSRDLAAQPSPTPRPPPSEQSPPQAGVRLNARSLGARRPPATADRQPPRFSGAIDARNLAASNSPTSNASSNSPPRFNIRRAVSDDSAQRPKPANRERPPRPSRDASFPRAPRGPVPRARSSRVVGSASKVSSSTGFDEDAGEENIDAETLKFMREQEEEKQPKAVPYTPAPVTAESLSGSGPALPLGNWGMNEVVEEWVDRIARMGEKRRADLELMVDMWRRGETVHFGGDAEKKKRVFERVFEGVEDGLGETSEKEQAVVAEKLREAFESEIEETVFKGEYVFEGRKGKGVLDSVMRQVARNGSFSPGDGEALAAKVKALLPIEAVGSA